jgi:hypothetical protein
MHGQRRVATLDGASYVRARAQAREYVMGDKPANKPAEAATTAATAAVASGADIVAAGESVGATAAQVAGAFGAALDAASAKPATWNARQMAAAIRASIPGSTVDDKRVRGWARANMARLDDDGYTSHSYTEAEATVILAAFVAMAAKRSGTATNADGTVRIPGVKPATEATPEATPEATDDAPAV